MAGCRINTKSGKRKEAKKVGCGEKNKQRKRLAKGLSAFKQRDRVNKGEKY